jgi:hypothetical protein
MFFPLNWIFYCGYILLIGRTFTGLLVPKLRFVSVPYIAVGTKQVPVYFIGRGLGSQFCVLCTSRNYTACESPGLPLSPGFCAIRGISPGESSEILLEEVCLH